MFQRIIPCFILALATGCGGATELNGGNVPSDGGTAGTAGVGSGSGGTGPTTSGTTSGTSAGGDTTATATTTATTGMPSEPPQCICLAVDCPDGQLVVPPDGCCPTCTCEGIECAEPVCPSGQTVTPPGHCCPQCVDLLCSGVVCSSPAECESGTSYYRPDGACCPGCIPDEPGSASCIELPCPPEDTCPKGFVNGGALGGCCHDCLPDPLYCEASADCVLAVRPQACCGCPEVISKRALDDDACWSPVLEPRPIPEECYSDTTCDALCGACPEPGVAACINNRCVAQVLE